MKKLSVLSLFFTIFFFGLVELFCQSVGDTAFIDVNNLYLPFNSNGVIADVNIPPKGSGGQFEEGTFLFSSGFWLSGYTNDTLWVNGVATATLVEDYITGTVGMDPNDKKAAIYKVTSSDTPFGQSWWDWKNAVFLGAEFFDGDGDGIYNPVDKNWNGTWDTNEDMPPLIGDEIAWCVFNDALPDSLRRWKSEPQGIEIRQTIFANDDPELENVIFIKYSILNTGLAADVLDSVYFGIWEDGDLGDHTNDVVGCDTLMSSGFYYNNTNDLVYGVNCPAFFTTYLQGPIIETNDNDDTAIVNYGQIIGSKRFTMRKNVGIYAHIFTIGADPNLNDPGTITEVRNYLLGKHSKGTFLDPCSWAYGEIRGGVDCQKVNPRFWVSGDPVIDLGWISNQNRETRNLVSTGPFLLEKDKPQEIIIAYVIGRGTDPINSITVARENVQRAIDEYKSNFATMTYAPPNAIPLTDYVLYQNYPNPFNPVTTIRYELPQDGQVTIDIFDILGQKAGTIVNEYKKADRYEVTFNSIGLASGVYIYQLRVNDFITSKKMVLVR